jgi:hypothetical protein
LKIDSAAWFFIFLSTDIPNTTKCVDDVLLWADSIEESFFQAAQWLDICGRHGIALNPEKFKFGQDVVEFAGFEITSNSVRPCMKYLRAILNFPTPRNITDVLSVFSFKFRRREFEMSSKDLSLNIFRRGLRSTAIIRSSHPSTKYLKDSNALFNFAYDNDIAAIKNDTISLLPATSFLSGMHTSDSESDVTGMENSIIISAVSSLDSLAVRSVKWDRVQLGDVKHRQRHDA